ncbi:hypothetical protein CYMTET_7069 [Cymbomonas tetramitiformis]|uniref:Uncharacterized protein n=1 Tax=Cymbomonas tetramitiformis TaxID=36881 RepID=A0AAE0LHD1_9CHLO|nr:hypothetical protein CYMTET_7069 [Cymbomonas tetramitiformis]
MVRVVQPLVVESWAAGSSTSGGAIGEELLCLQVQSAFQSGRAPASRDAPVLRVESISLQIDTQPTSGTVDTSDATHTEWCTPAHPAYTLGLRWGKLPGLPGALGHA